MIFTPHNCELILAGRKTQTRRVCKPGDELVMVDDGRRGNRPWAMFRVGAARQTWQTGNTYALQPGRGRHAVGRIRITDIRRELLQDITDDGAFAEGAGKQADGSFEFFSTSWDRINNKPGQRWADNPTVWVIRFELVEPPQEKHHG